MVRVVGVEVVFWGVGMNPPPSRRRETFATTLHCSRGVNGFAETRKGRRPENTQAKKKW